MTTKISNAQAAEVLSDVPGVIRKLASENKDLKEKVASFELRERTSKLASQMHGKNIHTDVSHEDLVTHLEKQASEGKLDVIEKAIEYAAPDMGTKLAQLSTDERGTASSSDFERFLVGGVG